VNCLPSICGGQRTQFCQKEEVDPFSPRRPDGRDEHWWQRSGRTVTRPGPARVEVVNRREKRLGRVFHALIVMATTNILIVNDIKDRFNDK
jgi:hypothetical protein